MKPTRHGKRARIGRAEVIYDDPAGHDVAEPDLDLGYHTPGVGASCADAGGWADGLEWLPDQVEVVPRAVCVNGAWAATLVVVGYPAEVYPGWLDPLAGYPARLELALHLDPVAPEVSARQLRRQLARLESTRHADAAGGRIVDPRTTAAAQDAHLLAERVARAQTRLHRVGIAVTVHADDPGELAEHVIALRSLAASMLLDARPTTFRALQGWTTTLPLGVDALGHRRVMDTDAAAALFPFASPELPAADPVSAGTPDGVLYGHNTATGGLVVYDRFAQPNYNAVVLAASGSGKSYAVKLEVLRSLYRDIHTVIIDPEDEYAALAATVGGAHIHLGAAGVKVNPLDLPHHHGAGRSGGSGGDVLMRRALWMHTVLGVLLGTLSPAHAAVADVGIHTCYRRAGITADPATWTRPAPLLADLAAALADTGDPLGVEMATRLTPYTEGSFSRLFDAPTTTPTDSHLVVFSLKDLPEQLHAIGTLLALDATWRTVSDPARRRRRFVVVDEAWLLLAHDAGAQFLLRLAKAARKHWAGLTLVTQDAGDVLSSDLGRAVVSNAATTLLMRTAPQAADRVAAAYSLSEGERDFLTGADTGTGLLLSGTRHRVAVRIHASQLEDRTVTTDPAQLHAADSAHPDASSSNAANHDLGPGGLDNSGPHSDHGPRRADSPDPGPGPGPDQAAMWAQEGPDPL
jgi:hypothetical protein